MTPTHMQGVRPAPARARMGRPPVVDRGKPTSVYLPQKHIDLIERFRAQRGLRSTSEAHRKIIEEWVDAGGR